MRVPSVIFNSVPIHAEWIWSLQPPGSLKHNPQLVSSVLKQTWPSPQTQSLLNVSSCTLTFHQARLTSPFTPPATLTSHLHSTRSKISSLASSEIPPALNSSLTGPLQRSTFSCTFNFTIKYLLQPLHSYHQPCVLHGHTF